MILIDTSVALSLLLIIFLKVITAASFSNVYLQNKPVEYVKYGPPSVSLAGQEIADISRDAVNNVIPLESVQGLVSPCVAPCVIPRMPITALPSQARASVITYKSPVDNYPIVLANRDDAISYQYSYVVYDEHTGDQKSQSEHSDGSVVRGQYSLIEPNGARREVIYTADDIKGFNAIVRNILPANNFNENKKNEINKKVPTPPCIEVKNEQMKDEPEKGVKVAKEAKEDVGSDNHTESPVQPSTEEITKDVETTLHGDLIVDEITTAPPENTEINSTEPAPELSESNDAVSYNDIIKCLQANIPRTNIDKNRYMYPSPLTYILLPSFSTKSCEI